MSRFGRHFIRIRELKEFEQRLMRLLVQRPTALHVRHQALFRYALNLAQMNLFRIPGGQDISVADDVDALRTWMAETLAPLIPSSGAPRVDGLRAVAPDLARRVDTTRRVMLARHVNSFGSEHLDEELRHKRLVLVLGGGGGSGFAHLGTFALLKELGLTPELIVGSSMGGLMGLLRAVDRSYDPMGMAMALPRQMDMNSIFRPFSGYSRFGFPGAFHLNLLRLARELFQELLGQGMPRFCDLPIRLEIVACGIRRGYQLDTTAYEMAAEDEAGMSPLAVRTKLKLFFNAIRQLSRNPRLLTQVVFGQDEDTVKFPVAEAVGFSCAVPGLLHYDIFHDDPDTIAPLDALFERQQLLRLCDGGVVNNVPSKVAWESVQQGNIGSRNTHIMAFDPFAPVSSGRNIIWIPIQQIARPAVLANMPYADYHKTFRTPPNPLMVVVNSYSKLKAIVQTSRAELEDDVELMRLSTAALPPYGSWEIG